eukprot:2517443-Amphidinium_carterae.1
MEVTSTSSTIRNKANQHLRDQVGEGVSIRVVVQRVVASVEVDVDSEASLTQRRNSQVQSRRRG